jgi:hypothetical protein
MGRSAQVDIVVRAEPADFSPTNVVGKSERIVAEMSARLGSYRKPGRLLPWPVLLLAQSFILGDKYCTIGLDVQSLPYYIRPFEHPTKCNANTYIPI